MGVAGLLNNLNIKMAVTEKEATDGLEATLGMEVEEDRDREVEEGVEDTQQTLGSLEFLTQDAYPSVTTLVDACNGFNELICLAMLWTVRHSWLEGARFAFSCYSHWVQLLLR